MRRKRNYIAIAIIMMLLATLLLSHPYVAKYEHHHCTRENCPICLEIKAVQHSISHIKIMPILSSILTVLCAFALIYSIKTMIFGVKHTLIALKVELLS